MTSLRIHRQGASPAGRYSRSQPPFFRSFQDLPLDTGKSWVVVIIHGTRVKISNLGVCLLR